MDSRPPRRRRHRNLANPLGPPGLLKMAVKPRRKKKTKPAGFMATTHRRSSLNQRFDGMVVATPREDGSPALFEYPGRRRDYTWDDRDAPPPPPPRVSPASSTASSSASDHTEDTSSSHESRDDDDEDLARHLQNIYHTTEALLHRAALSSHRYRPPWHPACYSAAF